MDNEIQKQDLSLRSNRINKTVNIEGHVMLIVLRNNNVKCYNMYGSHWKGEVLVA